MPQGLELYNESGVVLLTTSDRTGRVTYSFQTGTSNGSVGVPGGGLLDVLCTPLARYGNPAIISVSGNTVSWTFPTAAGVTKIDTLVHVVSR